MRFPKSCVVRIALAEPRVVSVCRITLAQKRLTFIVHPAELGVARFVTLSTVFCTRNNADFRNENHNKVSPGLVATPASGTGLRVFPYFILKPFMLLCDIAEPTQRVLNKLAAANIVNTESCGYPRLGNWYSRPPP